MMTSNEIQRASALWEALKGRYLPRASWLTRLLCKHTPDHWVRNIYGDEINATNARSIWQCTKCGALRRSMTLRTDLEREEVNKMTETRIQHGK